MVKYREILRLAAMGVSQNSIAFSCGCAQSTVSDVLRAARAHQLSWPLPEEMDDAAIRAVIYPKESRKSRDKAAVDHERIEYYALIGACLGDADKNLEIPRLRKERGDALRRGVQDVRNRVLRRGQVLAQGCCRLEDILLDLAVMAQGGKAPEAREEQGPPVPLS